MSGRAPNGILGITRSVRVTSRHHSTESPPLRMSAQRRIGSCEAVAFAYAQRSSENGPTGGLLALGDYARVEQRIHPFPLPDLESRDAFAAGLPLA